MAALVISYTLTKHVTISTVTLFLSLYIVVHADVVSSLTSSFVHSFSNRPKGLHLITQHLLFTILFYTSQVKRCIYSVLQQNKVDLSYNSCFIVISGLAHTHRTIFKKILFSPLVKRKEMPYKHWQYFKILSTRPALMCSLSGHVCQGHIGQS